MSNVALLSPSALGLSLWASPWFRFSSQHGVAMRKVTSASDRRVPAGPAQERRAGLQVGSGASFARAVVVVALGKQAFLERTSHADGSECTGSRATGAGAKRRTQYELKIAALAEGA
jgi:hypothetical protein